MQMNLKPFFSAIRVTRFSAIALSCVLLAGCESMRPSEPKQLAPVKEVETKPTPAPVTIAPAPVVVVISPEMQALKDGLQLYNNGDYNGAIKKLNTSAEIWGGQNKAIQLEAIKHIAFSYCVTSKTLLCQRQFERALKLDPSFDLAAGEKGHPLWGPVFLKSKNPKKAK